MHLGRVVDESDLRRLGEDLGERVPERTVGLRSGPGAPFFRRDRARDRGTFDARMLGSRSTIGLGLIAGLFACGQERAEDRPRFDPEPLVRAQLRAGGLPSAAVAVIRDGEVAWKGVYGFADMELRRAADEDTLYVVASVSKTIVSVLLMKLVEDGRLDLDAPIDDYLPFAVRNPEHPLLPITARMLAAHTSGLRDDWLTLGAVSTDGDPVMTLAEFSAGYVTPGHDLYDDNHFDSRPGETSVYCNAGFGLLGALIEAITSEPLSSHTKRAVFDPLGMKSSGWLLGDVDSDHLAALYAGSWEDGFELQDQPGFAFYPASSLRTNVVDLSRFLIAFIRFGEIDGTRVLTEENARSMREAQFPAVDDDQAFVWQHETIDGRRYLGHTGSTVGGAAVMRFRPDDGVGVVFMSNSDAFIRSRFGQPEGRDAIETIVGTLFDRANEL